MVQAWPFAWLMRIGSIQKLPMWTFLQTLTCWFFTRGKATTYLQYKRGLRNFSHHSKIKSYLEVHAACLQRHLHLQRNLQTFRETCRLSDTPADP